MKSNMHEIRCFLKNRIWNEKSVFRHEKEKKQVLDLITRTIEHGESNSALLIGPRGSGKTSLVNEILEEVQQRKTFKGNAILVKLHGLIHTDDRLALKSATSQMDLDNAIEGKVFGSFAENLAFLLACLKSGEKHTSKSVIIILEEFDLFCSHHNQTLLYNLFDISQSAQAPICVLGITCRLDVIELLEKRVKSRFSHRQYFLFPGEENGDNTLPNMDSTINLVRHYLALPKNANISTNIKKSWNKNLDEVLSSKKFKLVIERLSEIDTSIQTLKDYLFKVLLHLKEDNDQLNIEMFQEELTSFEKDDDVVQMLQDLSVLEFCLIISMKHHEEIYDNQPMNFEMILNRYVKFANKNSNMQSIERAVVMKAFEHIENLELIQMISAPGPRLQREYQFFKLLVTPHQITEAISKSCGLPTEVVQWANSSFL